MLYVCTPPLPPPPTTAYYNHRRRYCLNALITNAHNSRCLCLPCTKPRSHRGLQCTWVAACGCRFWDEKGAEVKCFMAVGFRPSLTRVESKPPFMKPDKTLQDPHIRNCIVLVRLLYRKKSFHALYTFMQPAYGYIGIQPSHYTIRAQTPRSLRVA